MAFQSIMMMFASFICLGIGALLSGDFFHWRLNAKRKSGQIITYKEKKGSKQTFYYPVAEYRNSKGETIRLTSDMGSSTLDDKKIGKKVTILFFPNSDKKPRILGSGIILLVIGLLFLGAGLFLFYQGALMFEMNWYTAIAILVGCAFLWSKFQRVKEPLEKFKDLKQFKNSKKMNFRPSNDDSYGGRELTQEQVRSIKKETDIKQGRWAWLIALIGVLLISIGGYVGHGVWFLETHGISVEGKVTGLQTNTDNDGTTYSPIVTYQTIEDIRVTFTSNYGSNPPSYKVGDQVNVLYDAKDPQENVIIDAGLWNWLLPSILLGVGSILFLILFPKMLIAGNRAR